jgi:hypothetical protein
MAPSGNKKTVSQANFARLKGVSRKTVTQWKSRGLLSMTPDGMVKVEESEWLLADRAPNYRGGSTKGDAKPARAEKPAGASSIGVVADEIVTMQRLERLAESIVVDDGNAPHSHGEAVRIKENYLALLKQLEYDQKRGAVVAIEDVAAIVIDQFAKIRNKLLAISTRIAPRAAILRSAEEVKSLVDTEMSHVLQELSLDGHGAIEPDELTDTLRGRFAAPAQ